MDMFAGVRAFVAVVEEGGFAPAARQAGQAASSFTRHVDALEAALGTILLRRSTRRVTLTPAGEAYYPQAQRILASLDEANRSIRERDGVPRGLLRVSVSAAFGRLHVLPCLPSFMAAFPAVDLDLQMSDALVDLADRRVDVAIRLGALESSDLIARKLAPHRRIVCASPAYLARQGAPQVPADLSAHACLTFAFAEGERRWCFERDGQTEQIRVKGPLRSNHGDALLEAALAGLGLAMLPTWLAGQKIADGRLQPVLEGWRADLARPGSGASGALREGGIHAVYLADRRASAKVRAFTDHLAAHFGNPPYWEHRP